MNFPSLQQAQGDPHSTQSLRDSGSEPGVEASNTDLIQTAATLDGVALSQDLASELGAATSFSNEQPEQAPRLSWLGRTNHAITQALRYVSDSLGLRYANFAGCDQVRKAEIVSELILQGKVINLSETLKVACIDEEYLFKHLRTSTPLQAFEALQKDPSVDEKHLFGLLMAALERKDPAVEKHCSNPPFIASPTLNEQFVARLIVLRPDFALRHRDNLRSFVIFDQDLITQRLLDADPVILLKDPSFRTVLTAQQIETAARATAKREPASLLDLFPTVEAVLELPIAARKEIAIEVLQSGEQVKGRALDIFRQMQVLNSETRQEAFNLDVSRDAKGTLASLADYQLSGTELPQCFHACISQGLANQLIFSLDRFSAIPRENRAPLVRALEQADLKSLYEEIVRVLDWAGPFTLERLDLDTMAPYWKRLMLHREQLGIATQPILQDLMLRKIDSHPHLVLESLASLNLREFPWKSAIAEALARKAPEQTLTFVDTLNITDPNVLNTLHRIFGELAPYVAEQWSSAPGNEASEILLKAIIKGKIQADPWSALDAIHEMPADERAQFQEVFVMCAKRNPRKALKYLAGWNIESKALRARVWATCAKQHVWAALDSAQECGLLGTLEVQEAFSRAISRDCGRAILLLPKLHISDPDAVRAILHQAIRRNASQSFSILGSVELPARQRVELIQAALRRNPRIFNQNLGTIAKLVPNQYLPSVIAAQCRGDISRSHKLDLPRTMSTCSSEELIKACALENFQRAYTSAREQHKRLLEDPVLVEQIIVNGITTGRWNSALAAAKHACAQRSAEHEQTEQGLTPALRKLDSVLEAITDVNLEHDHERTKLNLMHRIRKANCIPTDTIQTTLDHFGEDDSDYLLSIAEQGGSTIAENIYETLLEMYAQSTDITPVDRTIIDAALSLGFRGLSPSLFKRVRPIFEVSEIKGRNALRNYFRVAAAILNGQEIETDLIERELFPSLVVAAYRPVGMTEATVRNILPTIQDHSDHLKPFRFPATGYRMNLQTASSIELRRGESLDEEMIASIATILQGPGEPQSERAVAPLLKQLLQGAFDQIDLRKTWGLVRQLSRDPRVEELSKLALRGLAPDRSLAQRAQALNTSRELFTIVTYDALLELVKANLASTEPNVALAMSPKLEGMARRILRLASDAPVTSAEVMAALEVQFSKLFRNQERLITKEGRKFTQRLAESSDRYVMYVSKNKAAFFGRAGAGLCTHSDMWSWNSSSFLQMMMVDRVKSQIVGNVQLHLFKNSRGAPSVIARINPTSVFLNTVDKAALAREIISTLRMFADENQLQLYLPDQTGWHQLTNRDSFAPHLQSYYGREESVNVQITGSHSVRKVFRV
jgi:hypothetical protein